MTMVDTQIHAHTQSAAPAITCRRIRDDDIDDAIALLLAGFPERSSTFWRNAFDLLQQRTVPNEAPRYGYVLADHGRLVGIILLIFSQSDTGRTSANVSSWYVEPRYRLYSNLLLAAPMRLRDVTLFNISPAPNTLGTIEAQGFSRYVDGTFHVIGALAQRIPGMRIREISADTSNAPSLLRDHAGWGCIALEAVLGNETHAFIFKRNRFFNDRIPSAHLIYCDDIAQFVRFAGPLGRHLLRHGIPSIMVDAHGPIKGLVGFYAAGRRPKYFRGPTAPRLGDLTYSELALFGT